MYCKNCGSITKSNINCIKCGQEIGFGNKFCRICGEKTVKLHEYNICKKCDVIYFKFCINCHKETQLKNTFCLDCAKENNISLSNKCSPKNLLNVFKFFNSLK
jgi:predicted amidophosphoribosyltransferase